MKAESLVSPVKAKSRKGSLDGRKGVRPAVPGSSEIRMPPMSQGQRRGSTGFKPVFGTVNVESSSGTSTSAGGVEAPSEVLNGTSSAPLSRHTSRQSRRDSSPQRSRAQLPSPNDQDIPLDPSSMRFGSGPLGSKPMTGNSTAPILQNPFPANLPFPRPPRGGFGRGRGAYRNSFSTMSGAPNMYQRGYGMGHQQFYPPQPIPPYAPGGMYDPVQTQYMQTQMYGRGAPPPPPLPQTVIPGLDPTRFYVLGQVSVLHIPGTSN